MLIGYDSPALHCIPVIVRGKIDSFETGTPFQSGLGSSNRSSFASLVFNRNVYALFCINNGNGILFGCHQSVVENSQKDIVYSMLKRLNNAQANNFDQ